MFSYRNSVSNEECIQTLVSASAWITCAYFNEEPAFLFVYNTMRRVSSMLENILGNMLLCLLLWECVTWCVRACLHVLPQLLCSCLLFHSAYWRALFFLLSSDCAQWNCFAQLSCLHCHSSTHHFWCVPPASCMKHCIAIFAMECKIDFGLWFVDAASISKLFQKLWKCYRH